VMERESKGVMEREGAIEEGGSDEEDPRGV
jgi:hypothetical protein